MSVFRAVGVGGELRRFTRIFEADVVLSWDGFRNAVNLAVALPKNAPNVADRGASRHGAEGDDLCHAVLAVLLRYVPQHLIPSTILKVHVNIGHGDSLNIKESFKGEFVVQRVHWSDP